MALRPKKRTRPSPYAQAAGAHGFQAGAETSTQKNQHGKKSEARLAQDLGMRSTRASGALVFDKGDATFSATINDKVFKGRMECKSTVNQSMSLKKSWLDKIASETTANGEIPVLSLSFVDHDGDPQDFNSDWVAMPLSVWRELLGGNQ